MPQAVVLALTAAQRLQQPRLEGLWLLRNDAEAALAALCKGSSSSRQARWISRGFPPELISTRCACMCPGSRESPRAWHRRPRGWERTSAPTPTSKVRWAVRVGRAIRQLPRPSQPSSRPGSA